MPTAAPALRSGGSVRDDTLTAYKQAAEYAIQTMHTHLREVLTLEDLASVACLSPSHFNRVFRQVIGIPPGEFLTALRFQKARQLLLMTSLTIADVCFEVGYVSTGSFTSRFTQSVGLSPRRLRQRAHMFEPIEPLPDAPAERRLTSAGSMPGSRALVGRVHAPPTFRGTIYVGLFTSPIPQGAPVRCAILHAPGMYRLPAIADGVYFLRAAAFPLAGDRLSALLPGENMLLGNNPGAVVIRFGQVMGDVDLDLHPPRLSDPPVVMGLPLL